MPVPPPTTQQNTATSDPNAGPGATPSTAPPVDPAVTAGMNAANWAILNNIKTDLAKQGVTDPGVFPISSNPPPKVVTPTPGGVPDRY